MGHLMAQRQCQRRRRRYQRRPWSWPARPRPAPNRRAPARPARSRAAAGHGHRPRPPAAVRRSGAVRPGHAQGAGLWPSALGWASKACSMACHWPRCASSAPNCCTQPLRSRASRLYAPTAQNTSSASSIHSRDKDHIVCNGPAGSWSGRTLVIPKEKRSRLRRGRPGASRHFKGSLALARVSQSAEASPATAATPASSSAITPASSAASASAMARRSASSMASLALRAWW